jgi:hypothetical protein
LEFQWNTNLKKDKILKARLHPITKMLKLLLVMGEKRIEVKYCDYTHLVLKRLKGGNIGFKNPLMI